MVTTLLDWSQCPGVESIPGKMGGVWLFKGHPLSDSLVFENLEAGMTIDEMMEQYDIRRDEISAA